MSNFFFDTPWWVLVLIGLAGIALLISGNARQDKKILRSGLVALLVGIILAAVSYLVDTSREKVIKGTRDLVNAAVTRDKVILNAQLHPNASLAGWKRQRIIDGAVELADQFGLQGATITGMEVQEDTTTHTVITVTMRVVARFAGRNTPYDTVPTDWQLSWWETPDGKWLLKDVTPMGGGNINGSQMSRQYFSGTP